MTDMAIESVLKEERTFDPPAELSQSAAIGSMASYRQLVAEAEANPELFWEAMPSGSSIGSAHLAKCSIGLIRRLPAGLKGHHKYFLQLP